METRALSPERRRIVVVCAAIASLSASAVTLGKHHHCFAGAVIVTQVAGLIYAGMLMRRARRAGDCGCCR